ncbi:hypothetical protein KDA_38100 [Dictyobacter alpinus]|uniref:Uncharacterized protein n=1 Tax=Dictyobacter alpinus TaxID=2014873 RepID=A0A402BAJ1_9CHLR|nr:hypothetical protein [Dictyobacter alpinus]GCE28326.1 hypothetical protein KDA_38100 [Dictyobacter alpinus]
MTTICTVLVGGHIFATASCHNKCPVQHYLDEPRSHHVNGIFSLSEVPFQ